MVLLTAALFVFAHTRSPLRGHETSTNSSVGCVVRLMRVAGGTCMNHSYSCEDDHSVTVRRGCHGVFQCADGQGTTCSENSRCKCEGKYALGMGSPCHLNQYLRSHAHAQNVPCPPALHFPPWPPPGSPRPPPPPRAPPKPGRPPAAPGHYSEVVRLCARWCHVAWVHGDKGYPCLCAACTGSHNERPRAVSMPTGIADVDQRAIKLITQGANCSNGRVLESSAAWVASLFRLEV